MIVILRYYPNHTRSHSLVGYVDWNSKMNAGVTKTDQVALSCRVRGLKSITVPANTDWYAVSHSLVGCVDWNTGNTVNNIFNLRSHSLVGCVDWNVDKALIAPTSDWSHSLVGCVDWNYRYLSEKQEKYRRTLLQGAWIKIAPKHSDPLNKMSMAVLKCMKMAISNCTIMAK